jgi:hypothetical protein
MIQFRKPDFRDPAVRVCTVSGVTVLLLYAIALVSGNNVDVEQLSPSAPRKAIEINKRNDGIIHSGPGEPVTGRQYRAGFGDR